MSIFKRSNAKIKNVEVYDQMADEVWEMLKTQIDVDDLDEETTHLLALYKRIIDLGHDQAAICDRLEEKIDAQTEMLMEINKKLSAKK